jgi:hypothetical protein
MGNLSSTTQASEPVTAISTAGSSGNNAATPVNVDCIRPNAQTASTSEIGDAALAYCLRNSTSYAAGRTAVPGQSPAPPSSQSDPLYRLLPVNQGTRPDDCILDHLVPSYGALMRPGVSQWDIPLPVPLDPPSTIGPIHSPYFPIRNEASYSL